jgi:hypothetical protein
MADVVRDVSLKQTLDETCRTAAWSRDVYLGKRLHECLLQIII